MRVGVELFGIPRQRAGVSTVEIELAGVSATVDEILERLAARFPRLSTDCVDVRGDGCAVREHCVLQVRDAFTRDTRLEVRDGERILLMSADAGG